MTVQGYSAMDRSGRDVTPLLRDNVRSGPTRSIPLGDVLGWADHVKD